MSKVLRRMILNGRLIAIVGCMHDHGDCSEYWKCGTDGRHCDRRSKSPRRATTVTVMTTFCGGVCPLPSVSYSFVTAPLVILLTRSL